MGALIGAGMDLKIKHLFLTIDGRYGIGFNDISKEYLPVKGTHFTFMGGIGYLF